MMPLFPGLKLILLKASSAAKASEKRSEIEYLDALMDKKKTGHVSKKERGVLERERERERVVFVFVLCLFCVYFVFILCFFCVSFVLLLCFFFFCVSFSVRSLCVTFAPLLRSLSPL
jgi:uncharacterized membrane protein